jgi:hypothetical protein
MTIHLIKLAVGVADVAHLTVIQARRLDDFGEVFHRTRMRPKRQAELLDGGSIYWVIRGTVAARQRLVGLHDDVNPEGRRCCRLELDTTIVETRRHPQRAFQGWRYLDPAAAPPDLAGPGGESGELPPELADELRRLGLL